VSINCNHLPCSIKALLEGLKGKTVTIITKSGDREVVEIEGVIGDILVSQVECGYKFTLIGCICSIIAKCDDLIDARFSSAPSKE
jgi:hypothetical protein